MDIMDENIFLLIIAIVIAVTTTVVIAKVIRDDRSNQQIYKLQFLDPATNKWHTHEAGLSFVEANEKYDWLKETNPSHNYRIAHDTVVV